jgi:superoxide dismutase, Cu-Zn family
MHHLVSCSLAALGALVVCGGCARERQPLETQTTGDRSGAVGTADPRAANGLLPSGTVFQRAGATLEPAPGQRTSGHAKLEEVTNGVRIQVSVKDAPPNAKLGVHVVQTADCEKIASGAQTEHFNPRNTAHGLPTASEQHLGDLGNVVTDERGNGELLILTSGGNLRARDPRSFLDRAIVVDDREDRGEAELGKPAACAVIKSG